MIQIDDKGTLELTNSVTFTELAEYLEANPKHRQYFDEFYFFEIGDSSTWDLGKEFVNLFDSQSSKKIYDFFLENKLYDPNYPKADEDLQIFFHTRFVK